MARGTELAVGYVSLVAETSQLSRGINQALGTAGRDAQQHGNRMGQALGRGATSGFTFRPSQALAPGIGEAERTGRQMGQKLGTGIQTAAARVLAGGLVGGGFAAGILATGAAMTTAVKSTVDFQTNLNKLQGASRATASEMAAVQARARELGNDVTLTGTSAQDAAAAMTELVKGGFNVQQAMNAARGTLQLATAAQISAADAATIQADALHAFGLQATDAAHIADVLANVANASTGEMADFAYGFQAGGAVMHQFGISAEDAAATLGVLANAGIKSSDAGTLVKSMLLALASPSDQAAGALDDLGLKAFDAAGNFRGMSAIMEDLQNASQRMTPEMYAMATSTAFGSDAARLAGIAAQQGGEGFDQMRVAVQRQGAAAELAAANTQGLPGVFERLSNTADRAKLALGGLLDGPVASAGDAINRGINQALDVMEGKVSGGAISDLASGLGEVVKELGSDAWTGMSTVLTAAVQAGQMLLPVLTTAGELIGNNTTLIAALAAAWGFHKWLTPALGRINDAMQTQATRAGNAAHQLGGLATQQSRSLELTRTSTVQMGRFGTALDSIGQHVPAISRMQTAFYQGAINAEHFGRTVGIARASMSAMSSAASGLVGVLGGPWGAALTAATVGLTLWASSATENEHRANALEEAQGQLTASYREMYEILASSGGVTNDTVIAKATQQVDILQSRLDTLRRGASAGDWLSTIVRPDLDDPLGKFRDVAAKQGAAENVERIKTAISDLGMTAQSMGVLVSGSSQAWDQFAERARNAGDGGQQLLVELQKLRDEYLANKDAAERLTPGMKQLEDAIKVLGDSTATAADKSNALKTALDALAGKAPDRQQAQKQYNDTMRDTATATQEVIDKAKGFGDSLVNVDGSVNTTTENGSKLYESLQKIYTATRDVAASGGDLQGAFSNNSAQFKQLADQLGLTEPQVRRMAEAMGLIPQSITTLVQVNSDEAVQDLVAIKAKLESVPTGKDIVVTAPPDTVIAQLRSIGLKVEEIPGTHPGDPKQIRVSAPTQEAVGQIQTLINTMMNVPSELVIQTALRSLGTVNPAEFPNYGASQRAHQGQPGYIPYDPNAPGHEEGGSISGGTPGIDSVPSLLMPGEHVWTTDEVSAVGGQAAMYQLRQMARQGLLQPFKTGGAINPMAVPWGVDPHGSSDSGPSASPFAPWWDMDWMPPEHPEKVGPGKGWWWNRGPTPGGGTKGGHFAPPIGKHRLPNPGDFYPGMLPDPEMKLWGYDNGGAILPGEKQRQRQRLEPGNFNPDMLIDTSMAKWSGTPGWYGMMDRLLPHDQNLSGMRVDPASYMEGFEPGGARNAQWLTMIMGQNRGWLKHLNVKQKPPITGVPGFQDGGAVPDPRILAIDEAYRQRGRPYNFGPWDCSMYMSYIYGAMSGAGPGRHFSTESGNFAELGFKPGYKPGALNIGVKHGGAGGGHMAGTLPNGVNVENSSNGSVYGPGARGADDGEFSEHWYYEGPNPAPSDMVTNPTTMPDRPGQAGGSNAPGGGTDAASILAGGAPQGAADPAAAGGLGDDPTRTEGLIPAGAGNTAPSGSGFIGGLAGLGVQAANAAIDMAAQAGSVAANAFAPGSGAAVQMGASAAKRGVQYVGEMAGIWGDAALEILLPFGTPRWLSDVNPTSFMPQVPGQAAATTTMEEGAQAAAAQAAPPMPTGGQHLPPGATQGQPIAPGPQQIVTGPALAPQAQPGAGMPAQNAAPLAAQNQDEQGNSMFPWLKGMGIFDEGGVLAPNSVGANLGTTPEMVLTQEQWDSVTAGAANAPLHPAEQSLDFSTHIGQVHVADVDELKREMDSRGRLAMMRYSGRHK